MGKPGAPLGLYAAISLFVLIPITMTRPHRGTAVDDFADVFLFVVMTGEFIRACLYLNRFRCPYCHGRRTYLYAYEGETPDEKYL